jgi:hypothetical protein
MLYLNILYLFLNLYKYLISIYLIKYTKFNIQFTQIYGIAYYI